MSAPKAWRGLDLRDADPRMIERFWSKVDRRGPDECWPWLEYCKPNGYGQFVIRKNVFGIASRVALALTVGKIEAGEVACHRCDNPPCCNPAHLFVGTQSTNALDSVAKGRANRARGEATPSSKLTTEQVAAIRATPIEYGMRMLLAREYGVAWNTINAILARRTWRAAA